MLNDFHNAILTGLVLNNEDNDEGLLKNHSENLFEREMINNKFNSYFFLDCNLDLDSL